MKGENLTVLKAGKFKLKVSVDMRALFLDFYLYFTWQKGKAGARVVLDLCCQDINPLAKILLL